MNLLFEKPEPLVVAGANWPVLEYLVERFNRPGLEGSIVLRRTPLTRDLQLCLSAECNGKPLALLSEPFETLLLTGNEEQEQLIQLVSRFLLRAKHQHAELLTPRSPAPSDSLMPLVEDSSAALEVRRGTVYDVAQRLRKGVHD